MGENVSTNTGSRFCDVSGPVTARGRRHLILLTSIGLVWLGSCGGGSDDGGVVLTADQLGDLVAQPQDASADTDYDEAQSGPAPLDLLSQGVASAHSRLEELGFQAGRSSIFVSSDPPPPDGAVIGSGVFIFDDAASASRALEVHRSVVVPDAMQGYEEIPVENLGDEAFAYTFASGPAGGPGAIYEFRIGNAVFLVPGSGQSVDPDALLELARTLAARIQ